MDDEDEDRVFAVLEFDDLEEDDLIAMALEMCPEGHMIEIHEPECPVADTGECDCTPKSLRKGATA